MPLTFRCQYPDTFAQILANRWVEITPEFYTQMLGAVPPLRHVLRAFVAGEAWCDTIDGLTIYIVCVRTDDGRCWAKPLPLGHFEPAILRVAIAEQLAAAS